MFLVVSTSPSSQSRTRRVAVHLQELMRQQRSDARIDFLDVSTLPISAADHHSTDHEQAVEQAFGQATGIVFVLPIYHGDVSVAARNVVQIAGRTLARKVIGLASIAGDTSANFATFAFANSLMFEHRCFIVPDIVFLNSDQVSGPNWLDPKLDRQLAKLAENMSRITSALVQA